MLRLYTKKYPWKIKSHFISDPKIINNLRNSQRLSASQKKEIFYFFMCQLFVDGMYKSTYWNRLELSTKLISQVLKNTGKNYSFLDVGASDGSSSFYTHNFLSKLNYNIKTYSTDKHTSILYNRKKLLGYFYTEEGDPFLCHIGNLFMLKLHNGVHKDFISKKLVKYLKKRFYKSTFAVRPVRISLRNPALTESKNFNFESLDIFVLKEDYYGRFDIIRCSNLLHLTYFSREEIRKAVDMLKRYLKPGGYLVISRSDKDSLTESGAMYKKEKNRFVKIKEFNQGSDIEFIINSGDSTHREEKKRIDNG